ncbi:MAG: hypothetical protein H7Y27_02265, partial [Gemmatimonadaceae bacterium]|nr:hypothetical protein [Chitinophagaceae bacterium]
EEALFNLYYCYKKAGETSKMAQVKSMLESKFGNGKFSNIVKNPGAVDSLSKRAGSALYEEIYTLFIEGRFAEATARKKSADSIYGKHYWSPQLLYIESVYHIQERNDSVAKIALGNIISLYPGQPMAVKAQRLLEVLGRRAEIENYLTNLQIERPAGDSSMVIVDAPNKRPPTAQNQPVVVPSRSDSTGVRMPDNAVVKKTDTATAPRPADTSAVRKPMEPVVKKPTDPVRPRTDTVATAAKKPVVVQPSLIYTNAPDLPHMVVLVMDKVDPVYVTEARNAFNRYNREKFSSMQIDLAPFSLTDDTRFLLFSQFENAAAALEYVGKTKKLAGTEVIPWMPAGKYSFLIVTEQNLEILKNRKDIPAYLKFLTQSFPGQW